MSTASQALTLCLALGALTASAWALIEERNLSQHESALEQSVAKHANLPTPAQVFQMQSECADMGQKIMAGNLIGPALTQSVNSNYDPRANRCYVELDVSSADNTLPDNQSVYDRYLYDGQTQNQLAAVLDEKERQSGIVFVTHTQEPNVSDYEDALDFIGDRMSASE